MRVLSVMPLRSVNPTSNRGRSHVYPEPAKKSKRPPRLGRAEDPFESVHRGLESCRPTVCSVARARRIALLQRPVAQVIGPVT